MIGLICLKELTLTKPLVCTSVLFFIITFRIQPKVCNGYQDLIKKATTLNDVATFSVKKYDCRIQFQYMSKDKAINLLKNADLTE